MYFMRSYEGMNDKKQSDGFCIVPPPKPRCCIKLFSNVWKTKIGKQAKMIEGSKMMKYSYKEEYIYEYFLLNKINAKSFGRCNCSF